MVCLSWTGNGFYLKVGAAWVDKNSSPAMLSPSTPLFTQIHQCLVWDLCCWSPLWSIVCLKTLVVQPVSLKPCFYEGPVTHFPTMIWKVSGQILSWPLLHAVAEWFYLFLLNTNVHNFECDAPLTSPVTTTTLMILITLTPQLNVTILTSSNSNQSGWLSAG